MVIITNFAQNKNKRNMVYLAFEKPLQKLNEQLEKLVELTKEGEIDLSDKIKEIELKIKSEKRKIYANLSSWDKVQLSRHPARPYTLYYIEQITKKFVELHGDRNIGDDKAIVSGIAKIDQQTVVIIGQQKGLNTKLRQYRNFGMANPEGYRKALRLMKMAERFNYPIITFIDTPGAYPGIEAEERGQAEAIAKNIFEMSQLKVPVLCYVIGEGASGGALGIGVGDRLFMLENTWYSVISPENCSTILWRNWDHKVEAADALKLTADDMLGFGLIDGIVKEPLGGAHADPVKMAKTLKSHIKANLAEIINLSSEQRIEERLEKFSSFGEFDTI